MKSNNFILSFILLLICCQIIRTSSYDGNLLQKEDNMITNHSSQKLICNNGKFLSSYGCVSKCPNGEEYYDKALQRCASEANCSESNPIADPTTKTCVTADKCSQNNPFLDKISRKCSSALDCHIKTPYGDTLTHICISRENCNGHIDEISKLCISSKFKYHTNQSNFNNLKSYAENRNLFSLKGSEEDQIVLNLITMQNSVRILLDATLKITEFDTFTVMKYPNFKIIITDSTEESITSIINNALEDNTPYLDYKSCIEDVDTNFDSKNRFLIGQIVWSPSIISPLTNGRFSSAGIYTVIYDPQTQTKFSCKNLKVYLPDPIYHEIPLENIKSLTIKSVNPYNNTDTFYTNRCNQFINEVEGYDITLGMRRKSYLSDVTLSCLNYNPSKPFEGFQDCIFKGVTKDGYIECYCFEEMSELFIGKTEHEFPLNDETNINLDIVKCYDFRTNHKQPYNNTGIYFSIVSFSGVFLIWILVKFLYNHKYLIEKCTEEVLYNDARIDDNNHTFLFDGDKEFGKNKVMDVITLSENRNEKKQITATNNYIEAKNNLSQNKRNAFENPQLEEKKINNHPINTHDSHDKSYSYSLHDYYYFTAQEKLTKDKRTFIKYFWDQLTNNHILFIFFFKKSVLISHSVRWFMLCVYCNLIFLFNAMLYTEDYIEERSLNSHEVILNLKIK